MSRQFSQPAPGGAVSGRKSVRRQAQGLVIEYDVASTADEPLSVRLSDGVPTERAAEFGFHEDHEPEEWTLSEGDLEMTVPLDPGADRTVVFGLVADGDELAYDPVEPSVDVEVGDDGGVDDGGFFDDGSPLEDGAEGGVDPVQANDEDHEPAEAAGERPRVDADGGVVGSGRRPAGVVSTLVDELEAGTVSESELDTLRDHLGVDHPRTEAARLEYVQKRLGDFDAYVDALEDLLSVHGSGEDAVTELEGRLEEFADDVEAVRERQDELADRMDDLAAALETHAETVESLQVAHEEDVAEVRTELERRGETVREEVADLRRSVDADLAALEAEIEAFESIRRTLVDGLRRPEEAAEDPTVGDEAAGDATVGDEMAEDDAPDAGDEIQDGSIVEPSDSGDEDSTDGPGDSDEPSEADTGVGTDESDDPIDGSHDPSAWSPDRDRDVEESLETAVASNFSEQGSTTDDGNAAGTGDGEGEDTATEEDDGTDAAPVLSLEGSGDDPDRENDGRPDDGFVSPVLEDGALGEDDDPEVEDADGSDDADDGSGDELADLEIPELDVDDENDLDDVVSDDRDGDAGDDEGRATSIFEIGDVDSEASGGEEKPTIDFEDG